MIKLITGMLLVAAIVVPGARAVSTGRPTGVPVAVYVVESGDSLWKIAGRVNAGGDRRATVDELLRLNDLHGSGLVPGQKLLVPTR